MAVETIYETPEYRYDHDTLSGVGWYVRKSDDTVSYMYTGSDAVLNRDCFLRLSNDTIDTLLFHSCCLHQEYISRWENVE